VYTLLLEADRYIQLCEFHFTLLERWIVFSFICFFAAYCQSNFITPDCTVSKFIAGGGNLRVP
jgi:hypothetical protein